MGKVRHALHQVSGVGGKRGTHHFGVGKGEVRRRERSQHLLEIKQGALLRLVVDAFGLAGDIFRPAGGQEIGLLPEIEELAVRPIGILETIVARLRLDHWLDVLFAEEAADRAAPKLGVVLEQLILRGGELARFAHPLAGDLAEHLGCFAGLRCHAVRAGAVAALGQSAKDLGALVKQPHHVARERIPLADLALF